MFKINNSSKVFHEHDREMMKYRYYNIFFTLLVLLFKPFRKKNIWLFGCWDGMRYDDNSRYFFEYVNKQYPNIKAIWITRNQTIRDDLLNKGYCAFMADSKEGKKAMLHAGAAFYTNSLYDFYKICYLRGALIMNICHGSGGSKIQILASNRHRRGTIRYYLKELLTIIEQHVFGWFYFDYIIAPSDFCAKSKTISYSIKNPQKVVVSGFPRNDILINGMDYKKNFELTDKYKYILYMPTFRDYENTIINDFIEGIINDEYLIMILREKKYKILIKPHNAEKCLRYCESDIIQIFTKDQVSSTQELLATADMLITDYSSCCTDYALKNLPVLFYTPDWKYYAEHSGLTEYWQKLLQDYASMDMKSLNSYLTSIIKGEVKGLELTAEINENYKGPKLENGESYCSRLYDFVNNHI